ncbi:Hypothetical protein HPV225_0702 [Helicobacter pylori v225d]|nr:Hypothetical protein HPV225_0702 [Helicobacter pylori v225d]
MNELITILHFTHQIFTLLLTGFKKMISILKFVLQFKQVTLIGYLEQHFNTKESKK